MMTTFARWLVVKVHKMVIAIKVLWNMEATSILGRKRELQPLQANLKRLALVC